MNDGQRRWNAIGAPRAPRLIGRAPVGHLQSGILACGPNGVGAENRRPRAADQKFASAETHAATLDPWPIARGRPSSVAASAASSGVCASAPMSARNFELSSCSGNLPQIAHFQHFVEGIDEGRAQFNGPPGKWLDPMLADAERAANLFGHLHAALEPVPAKVEHLVGGHRTPAINQTRHGLGEIRKIRPGMTHFGRSRIVNRTRPVAGHDHASRQPAIAGARAKEIARAHDDGSNALKTGLLQLQLHLDAHLSFARGGNLRRVFRYDAWGIGTKVINRRRHQDARVADPRGGNGVVEHGQRQPAPIAIVRRVGGVHDEFGPARCLHDIARLHGIALEPLNGIWKPAR